MIQVDVEANLSLTPIKSRIRVSSPFSLPLPEVLAVILALLMPWWPHTSHEPSLK
jgi:hypothetical protein